MLFTNPLAKRKLSIENYRIHFIFIILANWLFLSKLNLLEKDNRP